MAKPKERKPLPDPKIWKWCKHPECMEQARKLEGFGGEKEQGLMREKFYLCAVFLEDCCWKHLNEEAISKYKAKIKKWVKEGGSLEGANLRKANLQGAVLWEANLQEANLWEANLQGAVLLGANLQEANLWKANLQEADLSGANLQEANLRGANL